MTYLRQEMQSAVERVRGVHLDRMIALGVPGHAIARLGAIQAPFGVGTVERLPDGLYQPGEGPLHVIMPVCDAGEIIDLIAWRSDAPANWAFRTGLGWALGLDALAPRWDDAPMQIHATPLHWLASGGEGMCVLDWDAPDVLDLMAFNAIEADDMIAHKIERRLSRPIPVPTIIHRKGVRRAA